MPQDDRSLERLAQAVRANPQDSVAFSRLHDAFADSIRRMAESFLSPSDSRVGELCNEMTVALLDAAKKFDPERGNFRTFANKCMNNRVLDSLKRKSKEDPTDPTSDAFLQIASDEDIERNLISEESYRALLSRSKAFLSPLEYRVLGLWCSGVPNGRIAEQLSLDKKGVENAKNRIKTKFRSHGIGI